MICLAKYAVSVESFTFSAGHNPRVFPFLTEPILFHCHHKGFSIVIYLDDFLVLVFSKWGRQEGMFIFVFFTGLAWITH